MVVGYPKDGSFLMVVLVVLCGMGALSWLPRAVHAAGVDLDSLPDIDDDQFWSTYKASIPYQDYVRLGQDAADYVDRYGPRQMAGENDTLYRFRRFLRIQKELDKRLLLYYEMNARQQEREQEYEENRELQKLSHELHANPPHPPSSTLQQQKQHRQHRFGQYQLPYPNQQMLDDVRPYPHEDTLHNVNNDFPYDHADIFDRTEDDTESTGMQHRKHHDLTNVANANDEVLDEDGQRWRSNGATVGVEASGSGAKSSGDVWEEKKGQEAFAYAPPDPRFYDAHAVTLQDQMDSQQQQHHEYQQHAPNHLKSLLNTPTPPQPVIPSRPRPNTFPLAPPRHIDVSKESLPYPFTDTMKLTMDGDHGHITSGDETTGKDWNVVETTSPLMVHQRNSNDQQIMESEPRESGDNGGSGGFRFNMVGKWPAFGTGIGEKHLVIGNPAAEYTDGDALQVQPVQHSHRFGAGDSAGVYIIAIVAGISAAATVGLIAFGIGWYNLQKHVKSTSDVEYPAYGVTGPNKELSPSGDRRLAQSAQMYHYQHQKQQIIAMERAAAGERHGSISQADSDEENEEGDYTVYECPGLAPTGEMEVKNPMFNDEPTPAQTPQIKTEQPQN